MGSCLCVRRRLLLLLSVCFFVRFVLVRYIVFLVFRLCCIVLVYSVLLCVFWSRKISASFSRMCVCAVSPSCFAMMIAFRISWYCFCFCLWRYVAMVCVCHIMFCLRSSHSWEAFSLCSSISKSSRCVWMSLCMWDVYILISKKVLLNFQCGDLFFCVGCGVSPMPVCAMTPLRSVNLSVSSMCCTCPMCRFCVCILCLICGLCLSLLRCASCQFLSGSLLQMRQLDFEFLIKILALYNMFYFCLFLSYY